MSMSKGLCYPAVCTVCSTVTHAVAKCFHRIKWTNNHKRHLEFFKIGTLSFKWVNKLDFSFLWSKVMFTLILNFVNAISQEHLERLQPHLHNNIFGGKHKTLVVFWPSDHTRMAFGFPEIWRIQIWIPENKDLKMPRSPPPCRREKRSILKMGHVH